MLDSSHHQQGIGHTDTSVGIAVKQDEDNHVIWLTAFNLVLQKMLKYPSDDDSTRHKMFTANYSNYKILNSNTTTLRLSLKTLLSDLFAKL